MTTMTVSRRSDNVHKSRQDGKKKMTSKPGTAHSVLARASNRNEWRMPMLILTVAMTVVLRIDSN